LDELASSWLVVLAIAIGYRRTFKAQGPQAPDTQMITCHGAVGGPAFPKPVH
jgi:hypothetical protein